MSRFIYSEAYTRWKACVISYGAEDPRTKDAAQIHNDYLRRTFGIVRRRPNDGEQYD